MVDGYVESEEVRDDAYGVIHQAVYEMRDGILDEAAKVAQELKVADLIADSSPPPGAQRDSSAHRYMAHLMSRADSLGLARAISLGEAGRASGENRLAVLDAINAAHEEAGAEARACREEQGWISES
ncbi:MAG TPA: hypothetical protein VEP28_14195 [Rubrobacter sp.]|nr:hypothetical protein [Rubrobacter sp.]